jgi:hypothetical protein
MNIEPQKPWFRIWMFATLLIIAGVAAIKYLPENRVISTAADAVLIAGILALAVDPLMKRDLLAEASRGIFVHLLGFEHHPQVKDKLKQIVFETKLLRNRLSNNVTIEPLNDGFLITVDYETEIVNPTNTTIPFEPFIEWDASHRPTVPRMTFVATDGSQEWTEINVPLREDDPGVLSAKPHKVDIKPHSKGGISYHASGTYTFFTKHGYMLQYMGLPTLSVMFRVNVPEGYEVSASKGDVHTGNYWEYSGIRMVGEHIGIRWRKTGEDWI